MYVCIIQNVLHNGDSIEFARDLYSVDYNESKRNT